MSEFSVETDKITSFADLLDAQASTLENAAGSVDSIRNNLSIQGASKTSVMSAMKTTSASVRNEASSATRLGKALREIASAYRAAENSILGNISGAGTGGSGGTGNSGSGSGSGGNSENGNSKDSTVYSSDPVNLNTGNFILDNHDMEIPGFQQLSLGRFYNSMGTFDGMLGKDWNISFEMKLTLNPVSSSARADASVMLADGREEYFVTSDGKQYLPVSGTTAALERREEGYLYRTLDGDCYYFDGDGCFTRFENPHHVGYSLDYSEGQLLRVRKDSGEFFAFSYDESGRLSKAEDHTGRYCQYFFEGEHLQRVVLPDGNAYEYSYDQYGKISRVLNPRGVDAVETEYDRLHRVVYQRFADGTTNEFEYIDAEQSVVMTERNGTRSIHIHNDRYQNIRNIYLDGEESFEYNDRGQKTVITDRLGNVTRLQYDNRGNITAIISPDGSKTFATYNQQNRLLSVSVNGRRKVTNCYNAFGELISSENGLGEKTEYSYDESGRVVEIRLPDDTAVSAAYDECGNLTALKNPNGGVYTFEYDALNRQIGQVDALGNRTAYEYDAVGRVLSEIRADGNCRRYEYDAWGNMLSERDYDGSITTRTFNENNRVVSVTDPAGRKTTYEYDSMWNVSGVTLPNGGVFHYLYDENNRLIMMCDAEGNETRYSYDAMGNLLSRTDAEGAMTGFERDTSGRCVRMTAADGSSVEYRYNEDDQVIYMKDAEGIELCQTFDDAGRMVSARDSLGHVRDCAYNTLGQLTSVTDEDGRRDEYRYARGLDKWERILHADGTSESFTYDLNGNRESFTDIYGVTLRYRYDELNRLTAVITERGETIEYGYDLLGRVVSEKDFEGNIRKYEYSRTGKLTALTDALGNTTRYSYDALDELTEVLREVPGAEPVRLAYERDQMGQIIRLTDAVGETEEYRYNGLGKMLEKKDRDGQLTSYTYNCLGLLQTVRWADGREAAYRYHPSRRLSEVNDWTGVTRLEYDGLGNLTEITYPDERALRMEYDSRGNRTEVRYPDGSTAAYEYDSMDRLMRMTQGGRSVTYSYDERGNVSSRALSDGTDIRYQYDGGGKLARMTHTDAKGVLDEFSFGYDSGGRRISQDVYRRDYTEDNGQYQYAYDAVSHLQMVSRDGQPLREYGYDALGNRSTMTSYDPRKRVREQTRYEYDPRGTLQRLEKPGVTEEFSYDRRGNLTRLVRNGQTQRTWQYDAMNRLSHAQMTGGDEASYFYNGLGYRVGMHAQRGNAEKDVSYMLDYSRIYDNLVERREWKGVGSENGMKSEDGSGIQAEAESYFWGLGLESYASGSGAHGWYVTDTLGSVLRRMDEHGTQYLRSFDEFGCETSGGILESEEFGYNGFLYDPIAGSYFAQARQYRAYTGTFDAMDRFGGDITMPDTMNPYSYCAYEPFGRTDKSAYWFGLDDAIAAGIGAIGGVAGQFVGDVITSVTTGEVSFSSWQEYTGAAIGGAAGGVTTLYAGPIAGGAVSGAVTTLTTEGLTYVSDPDSYSKSLGDVAKETGLSAGMGALSGLVSKGISKVTKKLANTKTVQSLVSKMQNGNKLTRAAANYISNIATGKSTKQWSQLTKFLKNQHTTIAASTAMKQKLYHLMLTALPVYVGQEILGKITDKLKPTKVAWSTLKKTLNSWLEDLLGISDSDTECAAAA